MCREEERPICGSGNGRGGDRMKVYTEKDLEGFERDDFGRLICPSGDYTQSPRRVLVQRSFRLQRTGARCARGNPA